MQVRTWLARAFDPGQFFEILALPSKLPRIFSRDDLDAAVQVVSDMADPRAVFCSLNPIRPDLDRPARAEDITCRCWLLIDIDPRRDDRNQSATDAEKAHAVALAGRIASELTGEGWPDPVVVDSGNGQHLRYRIDLPNDESSRRLVRRVLKALAARFDTPGAAIDTTVSDAARRVRLPGSWARKGVHSEERPHRMAALVAMPDEIKIVPAELLQKIAGPASTPPTPSAAEGVGAGLKPETGSPDGFTLIAGGDPRIARYVEAARHNVYGRLALAEPGDRNNALNRAAFDLGQFVGAGHLDRDEVEEDLLKLAAQIGLDEQEVRPTIKSGIEAGIAQPREIPGSSPAGNAAGAIKDEEWPEPFLDPQPATAPFPKILPGSLDDLCEAAAESHDCSKDYFGVSAVILAGGVIGMSVNLSMTSDWQVQPHLYTILVGRPGTKKSPALELMCEPLVEIDQELQEEFLNAEASTLPGDPRPHRRHLLLDDFTREAVALIHAENPRGVIVSKDEGLGFKKQLNKYRGNQGDDELWWLSVNSGKYVKITRKGNNRECHIIRRPCITVIGGLTPANLGEIRISDRDDGWFDRFLFCYPDPRPKQGEWNSKAVPIALRDDWRHAIRYLWDRQPQIFGAIPRPHLIELDDGALEVWENWYREHWKQAGAPDFAPELQGPWAKLELFTARIALIFSQLRQAYDRDPGSPRDVEAVDMHHAWLLSDYFKRHLERALHGIRRQQVPDVARLLIRRLVENQTREITGRDISRDCHRYVREPQDLMNTLVWLERHHIIRPKDPDGDSIANRRGRPRSARFLVNPRLFTEFAEIADQVGKNRA
jgi:hypothetical protein